MPFTAFPAAGAKIRLTTIQSLITEARGVSAVKTVGAEYSVASTTLQDDTELKVSVAANQVYGFMAVILHTVAGTTVDLKTDWTHPSGSSLADGGIGPDVSLGSGTTIGTGNFPGNVMDASTTSGTFAFGSGSSLVTTLLTGTLIVGSTSGTLQFRWAQQSASATAITVKAGSWMKAWIIA